MKYCNTISTKYKKIFHYTTQFLIFYKKFVNIYFSKNLEYNIIIFISCFCIEVLKSVTIKIQRVYMWVKNKI